MLTIHKAISAIFNISWNLNQSLILASEALKFPLFYDIFLSEHCFMIKTWTRLIDTDVIKVHGLKLLSNIQFLSELDRKFDKTVQSLWIWLIRWFSQRHETSTPGIKKGTLPFYLLEFPPMKDLVFTINLLTAHRPDVLITFCLDLFYVCGANTP